MNNATICVLAGFAILSFMIPALWNGFPLIFTDSLSYLTSGVNLVAPVDRPIFYGLFLRTTNQIFNLWGPIFIQAVLLTYLLMKFARSMVPEMSNARLALWVLATSIFGTAPWFISQISPDIFTACLFLIYMIWAFSYEASSIKNTVLIGSLMITVQCMHSGNIFIGLILYFFISLLLIFQKKSFISIKRFSGLILITLVISSSLIIASNIFFDQGFTFNRWGKVIFLARLLEDGPALKYLRSKCSNSNLNTCSALPIFEDARNKEAELGLLNDPELKNMVLNSLLWDGGIDKIGGLSKVNSEASYIIWGTLYAYPKDVLASILKNTFDQLKTFTVGNQLGSTAHIQAINKFIELHFFNNYKQYTHSKQYQDNVKNFTTSINPLYKFVIYISAILLLFILIKTFRSNVLYSEAIDNAPIQLLIISLFGFMLANASITGGISAVFDRYQGRVIWLLPATAFLLIACRKTKQLQGCIR